MVALQMELNPGKGHCQSVWAGIVDGIANYCRFCHVTNHFVV